MTYIYIYIYIYVIRRLKVKEFFLVERYGGLILAIVNSAFWENVKEMTELVRRY